MLLFPCSRPVGGTASGHFHCEDLLVLKGDKDVSCESSILKHSQTRKRPKRNSSPKNLNSRLFLTPPFNPGPLSFLRKTLRTFGTMLVSERRRLLYGHKTHASWALPHILTSEEQITGRWVRNDKSLLFGRTVPSEPKKPVGLATV